MSNICKPSTWNGTQNKESSPKRGGLIGLFQGVVVCCSHFMDHDLYCARKAWLQRVIPWSKPSSCLPEICTKCNVTSLSTSGVWRLIWNLAANLKEISTFLQLKKGGKDVFTVHVYVRSSVLANKEKNRAQMIHPRKATVNVHSGLSE